VRRTPASDYGYRPEPLDEEPLAEPEEPLAEPEEPPDESPEPDAPPAESCAARLVDGTGVAGTLSFLATFFFAFFTCLVVVVVSFAAVFSVAIVPRSPVDWRLSACLSSFASAAVWSSEWPDIDVVFVGAVDDAATVLLLSMRAFVPGSVEDFSLYDMPCGLAVFAGTVGDAAGGVVPVLFTVEDDGVASGALLFFLKLPIASALPPAKTMMDVVRNNGASLRMIDLLVE
jgi:hypothetical protein